jgi:hypothetical protein
MQKEADIVFIDSTHFTTLFGGTDSFETSGTRRSTSPAEIRISLEMVRGIHPKRSHADGRSLRATPKPASRGPSVCIPRSNSSLILARASRRDNPDKKI